MLAQYKDALEQLRKDNERMELKMRDIQNNNQESIQQIQYENQNLRDERQMFIQQIQNLEKFNKNQEKIINYFQNGIFNAY